MKTKKTLNTLTKQNDLIREKMNAIFLDKGLKIYDFSELEEEEVATWYLLKSQSDQITAEIVETILNKSKTQFQNEKNA